MLSASALLTGLGREYLDLRQSSCELIAVCWYRHDLFNTRCQFAVFEEGSFQRVQYTLHDELPRQGDDFEALSAIRGPKKTYRGPHMRSLFPKENNTGVLDRRAMLVLDVPGLPEASPIASSIEEGCPVQE